MPMQIRALCAEVLRDGARAPAHRACTRGEEAGEVKGQLQVATSVSVAGVWEVRIAYEPGAGCIRPAQPLCNLAQPRASDPRVEGLQAGVSHRSRGSPTRRQSRFFRRGTAAGKKFLNAQCG